MTNAEIADAFHRLFHNTRTHDETLWMGRRALKCPFDLFVYQEIVAEQRPDLIVECGTAFGGTTLFLANVCDLVRRGVIVSIDVRSGENRPLHRRINYVTGDALSYPVLEVVRDFARSARRVLVILDDDHEADHVFAELVEYAPFITPGSYLIVEDTNIGNPVGMDTYRSGPREAVERFLEQDASFRPDRSREKFLFSYNPGGYLRKQPWA